MTTVKQKNKTIHILALKNKAVVKNLYFICITKYAGLIMSK